MGDLPAGITWLGAGAALLVLTGGGIAFLRKGYVDAGTERGRTAIEFLKAAATAQEALCEARIEERDEYIDHHEHHHAGAHPRCHTAPRRFG